MLCHRYPFIKNNILAANNGQVEQIVIYFDLNRPSQSNSKRTFNLAVQVMIFHGTQNLELFLAYSTDYILRRYNLTIISQKLPTYVPCIFSLLTQLTWVFVCKKNQHLSWFMLFWRLSWVQASPWCWAEYNPGKHYSCKEACLTSHC